MMNTLEHIRDRFIFDDEYYLLSKSIQRSNVSGPMWPSPCHDEMIPIIDGFQIVGTRHAVSCNSTRTHVWNCGVQSRHCPW
jgi:hypothetical protein